MSVDYDPSFCDELIEFAETGLSFNAFAGHIGVGKSTLYNWLINHPEFRKAKEIFTAKSQLWWERQGLKGMRNEIPFFNTAIWIFNMKNRFFWREKITFDMSKVDDEILLDLAKVALEQIESDKLEYYNDNKKIKNRGHDISQRRLPQYAVSNDTVQANEPKRLQAKGKGSDRDNSKRK